MGRDQSRKRKGRYYHQGAKKARYNKLDAGMKGIMITCNNREREALKEAYNILEEYADILYGPQDPTDKNAEAEGNSSEEEEEEDIAAALKKEVDALKKIKPSERRFQQVETGTRNIIFIKTSVDNPTDLVNKLFSDCFSSKEKKSRYIMRMLPVLGTCNANEDQIVKAMGKLLEQYIGHGKPTSYCFQIKVRNNDSLSRMGLIPVLGRAMEELNPYASVDLHNPEHNILIDVLKTVACIGCVQDFTKYKKYNLQEVSSVTQVKESPGNKQDLTETSDKASKESAVVGDIDVGKSEKSTIKEERKEIPCPPEEAGKVSSVIGEIELGKSENNPIKEERKEIPYPQEEAGKVGSVIEEIDVGKSENNQFKERKEMPCSTGENVGKNEEKLSQGDLDAKNKAQDSVVEASGKGIAQTASDQTGLEEQSACVDSTTAANKTEEAECDTGKCPVDSHHVSEVN